VEGEKWVEVYRTREDFQMEFFRGLLKTAEIPVVVERTGYKDMPIIMGVASLGEYLLKVPPDLASLAKELLASPPVFPEDEAEKPEK
jgi:hypothetical protein